jgi:hypothetical protein
MRSCLRATIVLLLGGACGGGDGEAESTGGSETGGAATASDDTASAPTSEGSDGATDPSSTGEPNEFEALEACSAVEVCPPWTENFLNTQAQTQPPERNCVYEALRDGIVGRYTYVAVHDVDITFEGHNTTTTIFLVHADRGITFAQHHVGDLGEGPYDDYGPAVTCSLSAPDFFAACPTAEMTDTACYWLTDQFNLGMPWWTACVPLGPMCG